MLSVVEAQGVAARKLDVACRQTAEIRRAAGCRPAPRAGVPGGEQVGDAVDEGAGLAGARPARSSSPPDPCRTALAWSVVSPASSELGAAPRQGPRAPRGRFRRGSPPVKGVSRRMRAAVFGLALRAAGRGVRCRASPLCAAGRWTQLLVFRRAESTVLVRA
jgi:hypothetical protein